MKGTGVEGVRKRVRLAVAFALVSGALVGPPVTESALAGDCTYFDHMDAATFTSPFQAYGDQAKLLIINRSLEACDGANRQSAVQVFSEGVLNDTASLERLGWVERWCGAPGGSKCFVVFLFGKLNGSVRCVYQERDALGGYLGEAPRFRIEQGVVDGNNTYWFFSWAPPGGSLVGLGHCKGDSNIGEYLVTTRRGNGDSTSMKDEYIDLRFDYCSGGCDSWSAWGSFGCDYDQTPTWRHFSIANDHGEIDSGSNSCDFQG